jgi:hypothetical protein
VSVIILNCDSRSQTVPVPECQKGFMKTSILLLPAVVAEHEVEQGE